MARVTEVGKYYRMNDEDLPWVYAYSEDSGGIFGLEMQSFLTSMDFQHKLLAVHYGKHISRTIHRDNLVNGPLRVEYVESPGDGSSHGATWQHFLDLTRSVSDPDTFRHMDDRTLELQLDGLENMALEGALRHGSGWSAIHRGIADAHIDLISGDSWRQEPLYVGLGWIARNFAEREDAAIKQAVAA